MYLANCPDGEPRAGIVESPYAGPLFVLCLKPLDTWVVRQQFHLMDGNLVQPKVTNSLLLKLGLCNSSHIPMNSKVLRLRIQL